ncbi:MAG: hypothetical protein LUH21_04070 [Clostridiales bacterium]|nr:hypothetical protein [Clostridiales bacterium]
MARLENWTLMTRQDLYGNTYWRLIGNVYGHPRANTNTGVLCDGNNVMTSKLVRIDLDKGIATTRSGTVYELGARSDIKEL